MRPDRRRFLKLAAGAAAAVPTAVAADTRDGVVDEQQVGCLVDTTLCIGCRQCEAACNRQNEMPRPEVPFSERSVLRSARRPDSRALTVVNAYAGMPSPDQPHRDTTFVKAQCMHCLDPACVSACIVGALTRTADGAVVYNPSICIGCRYCMVACPFQIPAYEYDNALTPKVRKCEMCARPEDGVGANPACAAACPTEAIVFGRRDELLDLARQRIENEPTRYVDRVYGEHEVGGTAWLYLLGREAGEIGLLDLPHEAPPRLTEAIQHTIFRFGAIPFALYGALGWLMWRQNRKASLPPAGEAVGAAGENKG